MQFTLNHSDVEKRTCNEMYDAFRLGLDRNNQGPEPDYDTVLQSKVNKGYKDGIIPIGDAERNPIENYLQNQKPLRTSDFNRGVKRILDHYTPGPIQQLAAQAGVAANAVAAGAPNVIQLPNMTPLQKNKNNVQFQQDLNGITPNFYGSAGRNKRTKLNDIYDLETMTPSDPLMKNQKIPVSNRRPFEYEDIIPSQNTPPTLEYLDQRRHGSDQWEPFTPGSKFPKNSPLTEPMYPNKPVQSRRRQFIPKDEDILPSKIYKKHPANPMRKAPLPPIRGLLPPPAESKQVVSEKEMKRRMRLRSDGPPTPEMFTKYL